MITLVIDSSVAIKWVVEETGSSQAIALRSGSRLVAPDLLTAECANVLWKKVQRGEFNAEEADLAARLLERSDVELMPMRGLLAEATKIAVAESHAAYDCIYLALALFNEWRFVTADERLVRRVRQSLNRRLAGAVISLAEAA
jgi:predicted nucleic acid-binding protein